MYSYCSLDEKSYEDVLNVLRLKFGVDSVTTEARASVKYFLSKGQVRGVVGVLDDELAGFAIVVDYNGLSEEMFSRIFGCRGFSDAPHRGLIHNAIRNLDNIYYVVSLVCLSSESLDVLVPGIVKEFHSCSIVSDTIDSSVNAAYVSHGFKSVSIGVEHWYVGLGFKERVEVEPVSEVH